MYALCIPAFGRELAFLLFEYLATIHVDDYDGGEVLICAGLGIEDSFGRRVVIISFLSGAVSAADYSCFLVRLGQFARIYCFLLLLILEAGRGRVRGGRRNCRRGPRRTAAANETYDKDLRRRCDRWIRGCSILISVVGREC